MSDYKAVSGGVPAQSTTLVSADQVSIIGDGTPFNPLRTGTTGSSFPATRNNPGPNYEVGRPLRGAAAGPALAQGDTLSHATCIGLLAAFGDNLAITVQSSGVLELTTAEWDVVTGGSGGLTVGSGYWLDTAAAGKITATPPVASTTYQTYVGVAISSTEMNVLIGPPVGPHA